MMAADAAVLLGVEDVIAVLAGQLGLIHGLIGLAQQLIRVHVFVLRIKGDADAGRNLQDVIADPHRLGRGSRAGG